MLKKHLNLRALAATQFSYQDLRRPTLLAPQVVQAMLTLHRVQLKTFSVRKPQAIKLLLTQVNSYINSVI